MEKVIKDFLLFYFLYIILNINLKGGDIIINYIDKNTIDFIEYRESKKGIDFNLYMEMDNYYFLVIYNRTAKELNMLFNELVYLDKKLSILQDKDTLSYDDKKLYEEYTVLGQSYYKRFSFLEEKIKVLDSVKEKKNINTHKKTDDINNNYDNLFNNIDNLSKDEF